MDTYYLRQQMLARLEEFKLYHKLYEENIQTQLTFMRENLEPVHRKDLEQFLIERPDLNQWSTDMIQEINVRTRMLHGFYQHAVEDFKENAGKNHSEGLVHTYEGVTVQRHVLSHGSVVLSMGYNTRERVLDVEYRGGKLYRYFNVPKAVANAISEDNAGSSINKMIKGKYAFKEME